MKVVTSWLGLDPDPKATVFPLIFETAIYTDRGTFLGVFGRSASLQSAYELHRRAVEKATT